MWYLRWKHNPTIEQQHGQFVRPHIVTIFSLLPVYSSKVSDFPYFILDIEIDLVLYLVYNLLYKEIAAWN